LGSDDDHAGVFWESDIRIERLHETIFDDACHREGLTGMAAKHGFQRQWNGTRLVAWPWKQWFRRDLFVAFSLLRGSVVGLGADHEYSKRVGRISRP